MSDEFEYTDDDFSVEIKPFNSTLHRISQYSGYESWDAMLKLEDCQFVLPPYMMRHNSKPTLTNAFYDWVLTEIKNSGKILYIDENNKVRMKNKPQGDENVSG